MFSFSVSGWSIPSAPAKLKGLKTEITANQFQKLSCTDAQLVVLVTREVENDPEALSRLRAGLQIEPKMNAQEALDHEKM